MKILLYLTALTAVVVALYWLTQDLCVWSVIGAVVAGNVAVVLTQIGRVWNG